MDLPGSMPIAERYPIHPEVYHMGDWYPICGFHFWDDDEGANLFCKKLGFAGVGFEVYQGRLS